MVDINLDRHTVIEASAGTGKTYTLVELVLRLLIEKQVRLEQILLLTYTEKATGELKGRLRERLEKALGELSTHRSVLLAALDSFDQAHIHTIHSFCQRALQDYAFENGQEFRSQLVDDRDLLETCLREIQRKNWQEDYRERLGEILDLSGYTKSNTGGEGWEDSVRQLAERFRPNCSHMLRPEIATNWPDAVWEYEATLRAKLARWRELAGPFPSARISDHPWSIGFKQLDHQARVRDPRHDKLLLPLLELLADRTVDDHPLIAIQDFMKCCEGASNFKKCHFLLLTTDLSSKAQVQLPRLCHNLSQVVDELEVLREDTELLESRHQLAVRTIHDLQDHMSRYKRERGLQSFEDMLTRLHEALDPDKNPAAKLLLERLRGKYKFAIVDEFQDTDPIQWSIFKRIFVDGTNEHRLFVVGDPKQAIFGFRGADVFAYLAAKEDLLGTFHGLAKPLDVNWRSCPKLIEALNNLFESSTWFGESAIQFQRVSPPPAEEQRYRITNDLPGKDALIAVDLSEVKQLSRARRQFAGFIAQEIRRLLTPLEGKPALTVQQKGCPARPLQEDDFCILVYKRKEAAPIVEALRSARIPYSFYKQPGLWQSSEALHLDYLLKALSRPEDIQAFHKALLTCFYRIKPEQLSACEELPAGHEVRRLFDQWVELAEERDWARLFRSLLEDTGVLFHDLEGPDADRRAANYRHILQTLEQAAYGQDLDLLGILEFLRNQRGYGGEEDSDLQPIETEQAKVKIMTIHASKGLEFPIVFLAGGFTKGNRSDYLTYHENQRFVFDLLQDAHAKEQAEIEQGQEERRLLYVALTRAIFKLYLPKVNPDGKYGGKGGPVATILAPALEKAGIEGIKDSPTWTTRSSSQQMETTERRSAEVAMIPATDELFPQPPSELWRRRILVRSFSSLHRGNPLPVLEGPRYTERPPRADDDERMVLEKEEALRGTAFGSLIHDVLERINFTEVGEATRPDDLLKEKAPACRVIDEYVNWYLPEFNSRLSIDELRVSARQQVARLVWNGLHTPLANAGCALRQIPPNDRLQELEFYFPEMDGTPPAEVKRAEGFLTGFMDLVFRKNDKYFLVDWKTNALPGYAPQEVAQSMRESDYHRQYRLYLLALDRWLRRVHGEAFNFERDFGGVYYLYLRGMNGKDDTTGVFFCQPTAEDLRLDRVLAGSE